MPLEIDAGTAFGTGHHGTTAGCLLALDAILKRRKPKRILDLGCGTGVLAIAAAQATKRKTLATDIDPEAVRVTQLNAALNGVGPLINGVTAPGLKHSRIASAAPYDLIFANILARPLISLAQGLKSILAPGGNLILIGPNARPGALGAQPPIAIAAWSAAKLCFIGNWATLTLVQQEKTPGTLSCRAFSFQCCRQGMGRGLVAPNHLFDFRATHADIGEHTVVQLVQLALSAGARKIALHAAHNAGGKIACPCCGWLRGHKWSLSWSFSFNLPKKPA